MADSSSIREYNRNDRFQTNKTEMANSKQQQATWRYMIVYRNSLTGLNYNQISAFLKAKRFGITPTDIIHSSAHTFKFGAKDAQQIIQQRSN